MPDAQPVTTTRRPSYRHSSSMCPNVRQLPVSRLLRSLLLRALRRLDAAFVDLGHGLGDLARGELSAPAGGQSAEGVALVELRRGRLRPARLDLLDDRLQPLRLVRDRLFVALDELGQHLLAHQLDGLHGAFVAARVEQQNDLVDAALLVAAQELPHGGR